MTPKCPKLGSLATSDRLSLRSMNFRHWPSDGRPCLTLTAHLPDIYADIRRDAQYWAHQLRRTKCYQRFLRRRTIPSYEDVLCLHYRPIANPDRSLVHKFDAFLAHQVVESWVMRIYHSSMDVCSRITALFPLIEPAYRQRGGAQPTRRMAVEAAIFHTRSAATLEEFARVCATSPYGPVLATDGRVSGTVFERVRRAVGE